MSFTLATWNVLATSYITRERYPAVDPALLEPSARHAAVADSLARIGADVLCLQEVETPMYEAARRRLEPEGYAGHLALKGRGKPDGCATFVRLARFRPMDWRRIDYGDAIPPSGHLALVVLLDDGPRRLGIANTHVKWDPPGVPPDRQHGVRQMTQLLDDRRLVAPDCAAWVVCGDFNATLDADPVRPLLAAGFRTTHTPADGATCNPNGSAKMIDFAFLDGPLASDPWPLFPVADDTPLPSCDMPSDHVPVVATIDWV
jgi:endonuclease/exonuclease/phosphatase family metal-dependent hydrolase